MRVSSFWQIHVQFCFWSREEKLLNTLMLSLFQKAAIYCFSSVRGFLLRWNVSQQNKIRILVLPVYTYINCFISLDQRFPTCKWK